METFSRKRSYIEDIYEGNATSQYYYAEEKWIKTKDCCTCTFYYFIDSGGIYKSVVSIKDGEYL